MLFTPEWLSAMAAWSVIIGGMMYLIVRLTVKSMLSDLRAELRRDILEDFDGRYMRLQDCHRIESLVLMHQKKLQ